MAIAVSGCSMNIHDPTEEVVQASIVNDETASARMAVCTSSPCNRLTAGSPTTVLPGGAYLQNLAPHIDTAFWVSTPDAAGTMVGECRELEIGNAVSPTYRLSVLIRCS